MTSALRLFWWNDKPNFGDRISRDIVAHVSGRDVEWAPVEECELFAVGSIVHLARQAYIHPKETRPWIWGSGCIKPIRQEFLRNVNIAALRGPISEECLKMRVNRYGDPALLLPEVLGEEIERTEKVGIVPHFSKIGAVEAKAGELPADVQIIVVRDEDHLEVVRQIARCRLVFSSSLHGLIVADAFGVPSVWLDPTGNHRFARFKFYDYAASVGRGLSRPIGLDGIAQALEQEAAHAITYQAGIDRARTDLWQSFPEELRKSAIHPAHIAGATGTSPAMPPPPGGAA